MPVRPPTFRPSNAPTRRDADRDYDKRRGSAHSRGYTFALRKAMDAFKSRHPLCLGCQAVGRITATEVTDHVIAHKGDRNLLWSQENWQPCCREHHDIVKQTLEGMYERGSITAAALRLDSPTAVRLTIELLGEPQG